MEQAFLKLQKKEGAWNSDKPFKKRFFLGKIGRNYVNGWRILGQQGNCGKGGLFCRKNSGSELPSLRAF